MSSSISRRSLLRALASATVTIGLAPKLAEARVLSPPALVLEQESGVSQETSDEAPSTQASPLEPLGGTPTVGERVLYRGIYRNHESTLNEYDDPAEGSIKNTQEGAKFTRISNPRYQRIQYRFRLQEDLDEFTVRIVGKINTQGTWSIDFNIPDERNAFNLAGISYNGKIAVWRSGDEVPPGGWHARDFINQVGASNHVQLSVKAGVANLFVNDRHALEVGGILLPPTNRVGFSLGGPNREIRMEGIIESLEVTKA